MHKRQAKKDQRNQSNIDCQVTNSHVVSAFEQSLANMTSRLQELTVSAERKDLELNDLRRTIERLRQAGADAGLIDSNKLRRQVSTDSVDSCISGDESGGPAGKKKGDSSGHKRSGWLRNSFSKAFSSKHSSSKTSKDTTRSSGSLSDVEGYAAAVVDPKRSTRGSTVVEHPARATSAASGSMNGLNGSPFKGSRSSSTADLIDPKAAAIVNVEVVDDLKRKLNEKDSLLTEIR